MGTGKRSIPVAVSLGRDIISVKVDSWGWGLERVSGHLRGRAHTIIEGRIWLCLERSFLQMSILEAGVGGFSPEIVVQAQEAGLGLSSISQSCANMMGA